MQDRERNELLEELLRELEQRGAPEGAWLIDVARARQALAEVDELLRRLERALLDRGPSIIIGLLSLLAG